jgi:hypothetical protein
MSRRSGNAPADAELLESASSPSPVQVQPGITRSAPRARIRTAIFVDKRFPSRINLHVYPQGSFFSEVLMLSCCSINAHNEHDLYLHLFLTNAGGW